MAVVVFDPAAFKTRYSEFSTVADGTLTAYFYEATLYLNNSESSLVTDVTQRSVLLNMIVAHLAALHSGINGQAPSQLVGRITQASEGSVSVSADIGPISNTAAWWMQTKWGASFWQATAPYRTMRYRQGSSKLQERRWLQ
ncbi:MAG: DUF4054 domain-containing protein [Candidatus Binatia bacterium]